MIFLTKKNPAWKKKKCILSCNIRKDNIATGFASKRSKQATKPIIMGKSYYNIWANLFIQSVIIKTAAKY